MKTKSNSLTLLVLFFIALTIQVKAQFVHPGGVHNIEDLDRMKEKVNAAESPWIDGYNLMIQDSKAQSSYQAAPSTDVGGTDGTRQRAQKDATAAYYNILRWYITGDTDHADCAVNILNAWSNEVNKVVEGELFMLPIMIFVQAAEITRLYSGWSSSDINQFKDMCLNYFYPACNDFVGECGSWSGWDGPANASILYIGVFCDDQAKFDEAVDYYKNGAGGGSINEMIPQASGQVAEMGRDQPHAEIGPGCAAEFCQTAWNQGTDLFSYSNNLLLAGFEYFCKFNLNHDVEWTSYNDCKNNNFYYPALLWDHRISNNPQLEIAYNHYVVRNGLSAPYLTAMLNLRGIAATTGEYAGYNSLTYTLDASKLPISSLSTPPSPTGVTAKAGISRVEVTWSVPEGDVTSGFVVQRSTTGNSFSTVKTIEDETTSKYIDEDVTNGTSYYYRVASVNRAGISTYSDLSSAVTPVEGSSSLASGWTMSNIGTVATDGTVLYDNISNNSYIIKGSGSSFGSSSDSYGFLYTSASGDFSLTARLHDADLSGTNADRVGLVLRETLDNNSVMASIGLHDAGFRKVWFAHRGTAGNSASWVPGNTHTWLPVWFRITRSGDTFTGYQSQDGLTWFEVGSTTITMSDSYYAGMFVCASTTTSGTITTTHFDNVSTSASSSQISGTVQLQNRSTGLYIDGMGYTSSGSICGQWSSSTSNNQKWVVEDVDGTYVKFKNVATNLYIDGGGLTSNGENVLQYPDGESYNKQWEPLVTDNYYRLKNRATGLFLDGMEKTFDGDTLGQWGDSNSHNQQWSITELKSASQLNDTREPDFSIFPSPFVNNLNIHLNTTEEYSVRINSLKGHIVYAQDAFVGNTIINLEDLPPGMYLLRVIYCNKIVTKKILKTND